MAGKARPSLRHKTLENVMRSNLSQTDKECIKAVFEKMDGIVHCKDCKYADNSCAYGLVCTNPSAMVGCFVTDTDFCSGGKRRCD